MDFGDHQGSANDALEDPVQRRPRALHLAAEKMLAQWYCGKEQLY